MLRSAVVRTWTSSRRMCSTLKDVRAARKTKFAEAAATKGSSSGGNRLVVLGVSGLLFGLTGFAVHDIGNNPEGTLGKLFYNSALHRFLQQIIHRTDDIFQPSSEKLLPDWPTAPCYGNIPPGTPAPPLLVIDLERTLIGSTHDPVHGWRHVKRPGLDTFINALANYYEIVIFSENDVAVVQDILMAIDKEGKCHKLGSSAGEMRGTHVLKRLDHMNRDLSKIILIDDDPDSFQLFPRNTLQVQPFVDVNDRGDTILLELIPLLQAFVHEDVKDFRDSIDRLGTHDAKEAATEYRMRLAQRKQREAEKRNQGIGALIRGPSNPAMEDDGFNVPSVVPSPTQLVGSAPTSVEVASVPIAQKLGIDPLPGTTSRPAEPGHKKTGSLLEMLNVNEKSREEVQKNRREKMNELYAKRMREKQQQQQQQ